MTLGGISKKTIELKRAYDNYHRARGEKPWLVSDYAEALVGDVGDLTKYLVQRRRHGSSARIRRKIAKELADATYMLLAISHELGIDLEKEYKVNLEFLEQNLKELEGK